MKKNNLLQDFKFWYLSVIILTLNRVLIFLLQKVYSETGVYVNSKAEKRRKRLIDMLLLRQRLFKLPSANIRYYSSSTIIAYCEKENMQISPIDPVRECKIYMPCFFGKENHNTINIQLNQTYIAKLCEVRIIGSSSVIYTKDNFGLLDILFYPGSEQFNLNSANIQYCDRKHVICYYMEKFPLRKINKGIMLSGNYSSNYYHWVNEYLPRFMLFDNVSSYDTYPLIIDRQVAETPQLMETINLFNSKGRELIVLEPDYIYSVNELLFPSFINMIPFDLKKKYLIKPEHCIIDEKTLRYVRETVFRFYGITELKKERKIFLSRKNQKRRRYNEEEIEKFLSENGFEIITPEKMTFKEQVKLFSSAEFIVGPTGAALTNILFAPEKAKVLCLMSREYETSLFSNIAGPFEIQFVYIAEKSKMAGYYQDDFVIKIEHIKEALGFLMKT